MQHNNPFFIMKKILYSLTALLALASCAKEQQEINKALNYYDNEGRPLPETTT